MWEVSLGGGFHAGEVEGPRTATYNHPGKCGMTRALTHSQKEVSANLRETMDLPKTKRQEAYDNFANGYHMRVHMILSAEVHRNGSGGLTVQPSYKRKRHPFAPQGWTLRASCPVGDKCPETRLAGRRL